MASVADASRAAIGLVAVAFDLRRLRPRDRQADESSRPPARRGRARAPNRLARDERLQQRVERLAEAWDRVLAGRSTARCAPRRSSRRQTASKAALCPPETTSLGNGVAASSSSGIDAWSGERSAIAARAPASIAGGRVVQVQRRPDEREEELEIPRGSFRASPPRSGRGTPRPPGRRGPRRRPGARRPSGTRAAPAPPRAARRRRRTSAPRGGLPARAARRAPPPARRSRSRREQGSAGSPTGWGRRARSGRRAASARSR